MPLRFLGLLSGLLALALAAGCHGGAADPRAPLQASVAGGSPAPAAGSAGQPPAARPSDPSRDAAAGDSAAVARGEAVVRSGPVEDLFLVTAELRAVRSLDLVTPRSEMWQVQIKWLAEDGTEAKEGDRLIEFDNTAVAQTIEEKRLNRIQKGIDLESRKASMRAEGEDKKFMFERAKGGSEKARAQADIPKEILSLREWQEKQAAARKADAELEKTRLELDSFTVGSKAEIENLEIALDKAGREIESAQRTLDALGVKAPKSGIFVIGENWNEERKWQIGDSSWPGQSIASIPDLSLMEAVGYLADVDDDRIQAGMPARCILDTYPERIFAGKVVEVATVAEPRRGFRVRVSLDASDAALMRPGMSARLEVVRRAWPKALTVPRQAVRLDDPNKGNKGDMSTRKGSKPAPPGAGEGFQGKGWVARAGSSDPVEVTLAACTPTDCVVESGLQEGDHVALR